ncbi:glutamine synthetase/guanido kinase [Xylariaceae sp. FL1651]|nr:glutamine synthetase/guanido kinase [Xylariaceae sp. FL1651]
MEGPNKFEQFELLNHVLDTVPIIDNHAHPLLKSEFMSSQPLLSIATEANGDALKDTWSSLAHIRAIKQLAQILGCEQTWDAVASSIEQKRAAYLELWIERCLQGIETILVDDGLGTPDQVEMYSWHDLFTTSKCKRIVRIEALVEDIIARHCISANASDGETVARTIMNEFGEEISRCLADPEVVGFKSIICYRGGLDIPSKEKVDLKGAMSELAQIITAHKEGTRDFASNKRLDGLMLNSLIVHATASLISDNPSSFKKPIQFHTGLGDNDITLTRSSPSHLQAFIRDYPTIPIVILHASYPWTREAGYLAAMYSNVYADIGEIFPFISRSGQEAAVKQILELCPWSKILWSTDGHFFPETYLLATTQVRSVLKTVLGELVQTRQIDERQAIKLAQDMLFTNSKKLYNLTVNTTLADVSQLKLPVQDTLRQNSPIEKLRAMNAKYLRLYWHDYTSSARCRLVPIQQVYKALESGKPYTMSIAKAAFGLLQTDILIPQINATGTYTMHPDWSTLKPGPVDRHVSCFVDFREQDGTAAALCPRTLLRKTLEKAASSNLTFLLGFEVEFLIMERDPYRTNAEKYHTLRNDGHAWSMSRAFADWGREGSVGSAADEMLDQLAEAGIAVEQFHAESAQGQFELVLGALPPLEACDSLLHARQILESVAARHGFRVTLHPKPFENAVGSASHVHMSITSPGGDAPSVYEPFYAGILEHFQALVAFTYSNPTSYERMVDSAWAGGRWITWGTQNKEAPLRKCSDSHWELKILDGLANPYFALAAVLAAGTEGVRKKLPLRWRDCAEDPAKLSQQERNDLGIHKMFPADLKGALDALKYDREFAGLLHPDFVQRYIDTKTAELKVLGPMDPEERRIWVMERY